MYICRRLFTNKALGDITCMPSSINMYKLTINSYISALNLQDQDAFVTYFSLDS